MELRSFAGTSHQQYEFNENNHSQSTIGYKLSGSSRNLMIRDKNNKMVRLCSIREILSDETLSHNKNGCKILTKLSQEQKNNPHSSTTTLNEKELNEITRIIADYIDRLFGLYPTGEHFELFSQMIVEEFPKLGPRELWFWRASPKEGQSKNTGKLYRRIENQRKQTIYKKKDQEEMLEGGATSPMYHYKKLKAGKLHLVEISNNSETNDIKENDNSQMNNIGSFVDIVDVMDTSVNQNCRNATTATEIEETNHDYDRDDPDNEDDDNESSDEEAILSSSTHHINKFEIHVKKAKARSSCSSFKALNNRSSTSNQNNQKKSSTHRKNSRGGIKIVIYCYPLD